MRWSSLIALAPIALGLALGLSAPPVSAPALAGRATLTPFRTTVPPPANTPNPYPAPHRMDAAPSLTVAWDARGALVVTWMGAGCVWLVGGPGADVVVDCGPSGSVVLGGGGDAAYQPGQHAAVEWRPWGDGPPVRVAVPPRRYRLWLPVGVGR